MDDVIIIDFDLYIGVIIVVYGINVVFNIIKIGEGLLFENLKLGNEVLSEIILGGIVVSGSNSGLGGKRFKYGFVFRIFINVEGVLFYDYFMVFVVMLLF